MKLKSTYFTIILAVAIIIYAAACSKSTPPPAAPVDPCPAKNIVITNTITNSSACGSTGSIVASATGSTGFTYKLNSAGTYQASPTFNNLGAATYTVFAKDAEGCERSVTATVGSTGTAPFTISTVVAPANNCGGVNGSITISTSGSTGFTYKLNSGAFQASNIFSGLAAGSNTVTVKDVNGCEVSATANITTNTTPGPKFMAAKAVIQANCSGPSCHTNGGNQGGRNFDVDCNIVLANTRIHDRAVVLGTMPPAGPLSASNKAILQDWINTGGGFNN